MGLLSLGTPLPWEESREYNEHVRQNGISQLLEMVSASFHRKDDKYLWGDEVEYTIVKFEDTQKSAKIAVDKDYILEELNEGGVHFDTVLKNDINFHPEYGRFMIEATPKGPYDGEKLSQYEYVEQNMAVRRVIADKLLPENKLLTITAYPLMGVGQFTSPPTKANSPSSKSLFLGDDVTNRHVRFPTLTANIRKRRGEKVAINIPLYKDSKTPEFDDTLSSSLPRSLFAEDQEPSLGAQIPGHIYMDAMGFGMGSSCLQVTVQAPSLARARYLYDSWANFAPIFLSLTSAAPIFKGFLADQDVRWNVISMSVDDRTPYERDVKPLREGNEHGGLKDLSQIRKIAKSRYDSIDQYLGDITNYEDFAKTGTGAKYGYFNEFLNDINPALNEKVLEQLSSFKSSDGEHFFDRALAKHFAHLFIRDPLVIFNERIHQDNATSTDHFENIQSTNWQTLRFKPPTQAAVPGNVDTPGWRVEFRPMEIQITDFENAAFANFITLLGDAILANDFNFYIPISKIEENMKTAHKRDSTLSGKFHFKKDIKDKLNYQTAELSLDQIINGCDTFVGLVPWVKAHFEEKFNVKLTPQGQYSRLYYYFDLISKRASGKIPTTASYIRSFVISHPDYKSDSKVSETINYELLKKFELITDYKDLDSLVGFFGEELGQYLYANKVHDAKVL
ncbi:hypothetical protein WICPIJ_001844 [Wickerhamomyces pijperi]|uniref:Glutamate--cysteine ligase n=1 Tax=Wickerhamomyces pijperi TaxID=599730 RepID=A0A9P8TQD0_WICPI|nr:hypothetical protein WICPIJ_001844 [Wickerhamomyces pijperi]